MSETELLKAFTECRSEEAFADLVRRYAGLVYSTAKRRLANAALAEDITQLVFIRLARKPPKVRSHGELVAWLHRTTVNVTIDLWRSETRRRRRELQAVVMEPATLETAVWEEISPKLDDALNRLNDEDRHALLLRFFGGKTMREVGSTLGVSEDAAKMRVSRAVDRLRIQLGAGATACTAAMLSTLLAKRSVEAVPGQLVARLSALKLSAATGLTGISGWLGSFLQISKWKLAAGVAVLGVMALGTMHLIHSLNAPLPRPEISGHQAIPHSHPAAGADRRRFNSFTHANGFDAAEEPPQSHAGMSFYVLDAQTGEALAGTVIHASYFSVGGLGQNHDFVTDNSGKAVIPEPADKTMNVFVVATNHVPRVVQFRHAGALEDYTIRLDPAKTAGGLVVNRQGSPVAGVQITIQTPGMIHGSGVSVDFQTSVVTSDEQGHWEYSYVPMDYTNTIPFILRKKGYAGTLVTAPVPKVDLKNITLMINRGFTVTGRVTDSQNRPVPNAKIKTLDGNLNERQATLTARNGTFTITGVTCNNRTGPKWTYQPTVLETNDRGAVIVESARAFYGFAEFIPETNNGTVSTVMHRVHWPGKAPQPEATIVVQANGFAPQTRTLSLVGTTNVANFKLSPGNIFRGQVVDEAGNPIPHAVVRTDWDFKNQIPTHYDWTSRTDKDGRFEWDSAPTEEICYWFEADGYAPIRGMPLPADGSDHIITLKRQVPQ